MCHTPAVLTDSVDQLIERHIRRGNLRDALALIERLIAANPNDQRWIQRAKDVQEMLQPGELMSPKTAAPAPELPEPAQELQSRTWGEPQSAPAPIAPTTTPMSRSGALEAILQRIAQN